MKKRTRDSRTAKGKNDDGIKQLSVQHPTYLSHYTDVIIMGLYQYIKILTVCVSVRLSVCNGSGMFVGRDYTIVTRDLRTIEPRTPRRMFENIGHGSF